MSDGGHTTRGSRVLLWSALAALLCIAAIALPDAWIDPITRLLGPDPDAPTAFSDAANRLDAQLAAGEAELDAHTARRLVPQVAARRLTRAGPMTEQEVARASDIWSEAMRGVADEPEGGSPEAHYARARRRIAESFPRLDPEVVDRELETLRAEVDAAMKPQGGASLDCASCHTETRELPPGRRFDATGIYPHIGDHPAFAGGRRVPVLVESIEVDAWEKANVDCLTCHMPHGERNFGVTHANRIENMGLWVEALPTDPAIVHVEVKVKNHLSAHRAPAGKPQAAYVLTVKASQDGRTLPLRSGPRLPRHLRDRGFLAGRAFTRHYVDETGAVTTDGDEIADLVGDSRLESGRFSQKNFVFDRAGSGEVRLEVVLWYLSDYSTWEGASAVRRVDSTEREELEN